MSVSEKDSPLGEAVNMRRSGVWMPAQTTNPVIEVIDGDQEDIGFSFWAGSRARLRERKRKQGAHRGGKESIHLGSDSFRSEAVARNPVSLKHRHRIHPTGSTPEKT